MKTLNKLNQTIMINVIITVLLIIVACGKDSPKTAYDLDGQWDLISHECCDLPKEVYNLNNIIWIFNTTNQNVTISNNIVINESSQYNFIESGTYRIQLTEDEKKIVIYYKERERNYNYIIIEDTLMLSNSPESDGPILIFNK